MPSAAIATRNVDFVLPVAEMPQRLLDLAGSAGKIRLPHSDEFQPSRLQPDRSDEAETALKEIKALVRKRTGHDFTYYKRATVLRRIERRLQVTARQSLPEYRDYLIEHPDEIDGLLQDLLISVTNFFRDREAFETLDREVIPRLYEGRDADQPIRVWAAGCATGEEAYSLAMQLRDWAESQKVTADFQIFATDIDERALTIGRAGSYPLSIVTDVSASRLRRHFVRDGDRYRINKSLRERVLFARHNVLRDPPFSRIDLVCCRNLLIYVDRIAQRQILETFRYSLNPSGHLFLGTSETPDESSGYRTVDKKHRLYAIGAGLGHARPRLQPPDPDVVRTTPARPVAAAGERRDRSFEALHHEAMRNFASGSVLVDASQQLLHLSPGAGRFLEHAGGVPSHNLATVVHPALRLELRKALLRASHTGRSVAAQTVAMQRDGRVAFVNMTVRPVASKVQYNGLTVVVFEEVDESLQVPALTADGGARGIVEHLEEELARQKGELQESLEQSETSTEELKASNEELQAINEELRSATEELETGKEELQSMNEELITVNYELKSKIDETGKVNDDLQNLIASTEIATVFVDNELRVKRYTPRALDLFNLIPSDIGRALLDIRHRLDYDELAADASAALRSLRLIEREIGSVAGASRVADGSRFLVRVLPYRTLSDQIDGAIITFVDVTTLREAEARLRENESRLHLAAATTKDFAILTMTDDGIVTTWNEGAERMYGYAAAEIVGQSAAVLFTPEDREAGVPGRELILARSLGRAEDDRWHLRKDQTRFFCSGVVTPFESGDLRGLAKIGRDVTGLRREHTTREAMLVDERAARAQFEAASHLKDEFLAVMSHELKHPLNLIHVNAELLTRMPKVRDVPAAVRAAQTIRKTVIGQGKIIDDLLDLSRVRTGKLTLQVEAVQLGTTLRGIVETVQADANAKRITLDYRAEDDLPAVACDPVRIEQIAWNLLSNALKFTPEDGRIDVVLERDERDARLTVTDSGRGIAPHFLPHVFDMFGQEASGPARAEGGMGIGLALVQQLAQAHGGRVEAYSDGLGRGARFTVWLPFHDVPARDEADGHSVGLRSLAGLQVLVVEDSREAIEPFIELLRLEGAQPVPAHDGREAIELLDRQPFDLIISDIAMPDLDGYEFIEAVRQRERSTRIVAIALTGFGRVKDKQQAIDAGFDAHVTKPASIRDIRRVLAQIPPIVEAGSPASGAPDETHAAASRTGSEAPTRARK